MKRRLIAALRAGSAALDRLAQAVAAGEPDELEQVRVRIRKLERASADLQEWARAEGAARTLSLEALAGGPPSDFDRTILAARKAGGAS